MKPGYKTSEFWFSAAAMLLSLFMASGIIDFDDDAAGTGEKVVLFVAAALTSLGYSVSRGLAKRNSDGG